MLHKYLPRVGAGVLAAACLTACSDAAGPDELLPSGPPAPRLLVTLPGHVGDTLVRPGVEFTAVLSDSTTPRSVRLVVDSGTAAQTGLAYGAPWSGELGPIAATSIPAGSSNTDRARVGGLYVLAAVPAGLHTFTIVAADSAGRQASAQVTRSVAVAETPYALTVLPSLGGAAGAAGMNAAGVVAGWVTPEGTTARRPALWRDGALQTPVPADATPPLADAVAVRVNAAGDVLVQGYRRGPTYGAYASGVYLVAPDGALRELSGATSLLAGDLSDARQAVVQGDGGGIVGRLFDAATGALSRTLPMDAATINAAGQVAGSAPHGDGGLYPSRLLATDGFTAPANPNPSALRYRNGCDRFGRSVVVRPVDLDESATLLVNFCANRVLVPIGGAPQYVDRYVGAGAARLSRRGGLVASVDSATSVVYLWRVGADRPTRLRLPAGPVRVDTVAAVNAAGQVAATGTDTRTGRSVAVFLTPAP